VRVYYIYTKYVRMRVCIYAWFPLESKERAFYIEPTYMYIPHLDLEVLT